MLPSISSVAPAFPAVVMQKQLHKEIGAITVQKSRSLCLFTWNVDKSIPSDIAMFKSISFDPCVQEPNHKLQRRKETKTLTRTQCCTHLFFHLNMKTFRLLLFHEQKDLSWNVRISAACKKSHMYLDVKRIVRDINGTSTSEDAVWKPRHGSVESYHRQSIPSLHIYVCPAHTMIRDRVTKKSSSLQDPSILTSRDWPIHQCHRNCLSYALVWSLTALLNFKHLCFVLIFSCITFGFLGFSSILIESSDACWRTARCLAISVSVAQDVWCPFLGIK